MSLTKSSNFDIVFFTGLTDKNGKEIFKGDILCCIHRKFNREVEMVWDEEKYSFAIKEPNNPRYTTTIPEFKKYNEFEIIGNIYENPELLEVGV